MKILSSIKNHFKKNKKRYLEFVTILLITIAILELFSWLALRLVFDKNKSVNSFTDNMGCSYMDMLIPHPYLGYTYGPRASCQFPKEFEYTKEGFLGKEIPHYKSKEDFYIMLTGGSVANMMAGAIMGKDHIIAKNGKNFLEEHLKSCYNPPKNFQNFVVLNFGIGAWKQPQQAIAAMLFGDRVQAIVTLDGYNEYLYFDQPYTGLELPSNIFGYLTKLRLTGNSSLETMVNTISTLTTWKYRNPILKHSQTLELIIVSFNKITGNGNPNVNPTRHDQKVSYAGQFGFPDDWDVKQKAQYNLTQYLKYLRAIHQLGKLYDTKTISFLQPIPPLYKNLTDEEKSVVLKYTPDLSYRDLYLKIEKNFLGLQKEGLKVYSLTKIYNNVNETIYSDSIHAQIIIDDKGEFHSLGYEIMAKEMAKELARQWHFTAKNNQGCQL